MTHRRNTSGLRNQYANNTHCKHCSAELTPENWRAIMRKGRLYVFPGCNPCINARQRALEKSRQPNRKAPKTATDIQSFLCKPWVKHV